MRFKLLSNFIYMTYKNKLRVSDLQSNDKKRISTNNTDINQRKYTVHPLDNQQGSGAILDLIFRVAPHLLQPIAEALGTKVSKFIRGEGFIKGEGNRLAGNGNRLAGNGVRLAGDLSANKPKRIQAKNAKVGRGRLLA